MAVIWGAYHHRLPNLDSNMNLFNVISDGGSGIFGEYLLIESGHGEVFFSKGKGNEGDLGRISCSGERFHRSCRWHSSIAFQSYTPNLFVTLCDFLKRVISVRIDRMPKNLARWLKTLLMADYQEGVSFHTIQLFKNIGIFHLFVFSGFHVSSLYSFFRFLHQLPLRLFREFGLINPISYSRLLQIESFSVSFLVFVFIAAIGFGPASMRAFLLFASYEVLGFLVGRNDKKRLILLAAFLQTIFFPLGLFSLSTVLSWGCFLVIKLTSIPEAGFPQRFLKGAIKQHFLVLFSGILVGKVTLLGVICNSLLMPLFPLIFYLLILSLFFDFPFFHEMTNLILRLWSDIIHWLSDYAIVETLASDLHIRYLSGLILIIFLYLVQKVGSTS